MRITNNLYRPTAGVNIVLLDFIKFLSIYNDMLVKYKF